MHLIKNERVETMMYNNDVVESADCSLNTFTAQLAYDQNNFSKNATRMEKQKTKQTNKKGINYKTKLTFVTIVYISNEIAYFEILKRFLELNSEIWHTNHVCVSVWNTLKVLSMPIVSHQAMLFYFFIIIIILFQIFCTARECAHQKRRKITRSPYNQEVISIRTHILSL